MKIDKLNTHWLLTMALLWMSGQPLSSQENVTTLGIQFRPMVASQYFGSGDETFEGDSLTVELDPRYGHNFGLVIRRGITRMWSFETGISVVQRNYKLRMSHVTFTTPQEIRFRFIGYEIPLQGLIYVQLGTRWWMNASGGISLDIYPSNVESSTDARQDSIVYDYYQKTWRTSWLQVGLLANYGFEFRTKKSGYFYMGTSYHRPFSDIALVQTVFKRDNVPSRLDFALSGNYLTLDLRYFFHEDPERQTEKKTKRN
ncbi:MAG: outer membrane beta-barrel protein [Flavobacteriales bacterium]|nr:outer membrane beta-barrel protein [Flavobacteriales bacterium]